MSTQDKTKEANKVMAMIIASLIIVVSIFIALAYIHAPLEVANTPFKTKTYIQNCIIPEETIKDFVKCLSKHNKLLKDIPTEMKITAVKQSYSLLLVNGKARSVTKYLIFDILNESEFKFDTIMIEVVNKDQKDNVLWKKEFTINNANLLPDQTSYIELDVGRRLNNFEWSIIYLK